MNKNVMPVVLVISGVLLILNNSNNGKNTTDNYKAICNKKGLELKTSAYDVKKKRFVIYCE